MMTVSKGKNFTFWKARFRKEPYSMTAQDLFTSAFEDTNAQDRLLRWGDEENPEYANFHSFITKFAHYRGFFCAEFLSYDKDRVEHTIEEDFDKPEIDSTHLPPPINQQFVDGRLHLVCYENDLVLAQDRRLMGYHLVKYLNALLPNYDQINFPEDQKIILQRPVSENKRGIIKGVKGINLSADLIKNENSGGSYIWESIKTFARGYSPTAFDSDTEGFIEEKDMRVSMYLRWDQRYKEQRGESDKVDAFANSLRYINEEIDVEILTSSGRWQRYKDFILTANRSVKHIDDKPDNQDIFHKMIDWHKKLKNDGDI
ncbi:MAG: hypothetical protein OXI94_08345 [Gemmatimonadota bacterium]|nr:hypothetical protein [Gemmatimonadota bacterium]